MICNKISGLAIIESSDAVMVTDLEASQDVKNIVTTLKNKDVAIANNHRKGRRPWGYYDSIDQGNGFKVKRIVVNPGCCLSLQRHQQRAEHWIVVDGEAVVRIGDTERTVHVNESVYIEKKQIHRLTNKTNKPLILIEVQVGSYLGEDDIERLEDVYGRN